MSDERHNPNTEQERRVREAIRSSGELRADAAFRERLKREFSSGTIVEPAAPREDSRTRSFPRWAWVLVPVAAVLLLFAYFLPRTPAPAWSIQAVYGEGSIEIDGQSVATGESERLATALLAGGHVRLPDEVGLDLRLDDRMILALDAGSDATLPAPAELDAHGVLIAEVHDGEAHIMTGPGFPGIEMHFLTAESRTQITGTIVSVYKDYGYTCVCVLEGTALVGPDETRLEEVGAGRLMIMFDDGSDPMVTDISSDHEADLLEFEERYKGIFEP
jgi:ferric-dicitrate binding protein FerR (iron transport regulator)